MKDKIGSVFLYLAFTIAWIGVAFLAYVFLVTAS